MENLGNKKHPTNKFCGFTGLIGTSPYKNDSADFFVQETYQPVTCPSVFVATKYSYPAMPSFPFCSNAPFLNGYFSPSLRNVDYLHICTSTKKGVGWVTRRRKKYDIFKVGADFEKVFVVPVNFLRENPASGDPIREESSSNLFRPAAI